MRMYMCLYVCLCVFMRAFSRVCMCACVRGHVFLCVYLRLGVCVLVVFDCNERNVYFSFLNRIHMRVFDIPPLKLDIPPLKHIHTRVYTHAYTHRLM